jgi:hypothetical protein
LSGGGDAVDRQSSCQPLPKDWADDAERRNKAHVPAAINFKTNAGALSVRRGRSTWSGVQVRGRNGLWPSVRGGQSSAQPVIGTKKATMAAARKLADGHRSDFAANVFCACGSSMLSKAVTIKKSNPQVVQGDLWFIGRR